MGSSEGLPAENPPYFPSSKGTFPIVFCEWTSWPKHYITKKLLPASVFTKAGALSFPRLRTLLFTEPERKKHLEELIHPLVFQEVSKEIERVRLLGEKLAVETALPNQDFLSQCDLIFYLDASEETRCKRLIESRGLEKEEAFQIIHSQSVERFKEQAQLVINTEESIERVRDEICQYFQRL